MHKISFWFYTREHRITYGLLMLSVFCVITFFYGCEPAEESNELCASLRSGDVVCRVGNGIWSDIFRRISQRDTRFSHAGIILREADGSLWVVHSEADDFTGRGEVYIEPLQDFQARGNGVWCFRLKDEHRDLQQQETVNRKLKDYAGIPFDLKFSLETADSLYCTEFVYRFFADLEPAVMLPVARHENRAYVPVDSCCAPELFLELGTLQEL